MWFVCCVRVPPDTHLDREYMSRLPVPLPSAPCVRRTTRPARTPPTSPTPRSTSTPASGASSASTPTRATSPASPTSVPLTVCRRAVSAGQSIRSISGPGWFAQNRRRLGFGDFDVSVSPPFPARESSLARVNGFHPCIFVV